MNNYSLSNKWFIPREEKFEEEGFSTFQVLKQVLIHIKDHFQQLPGGKIDLNTITMKVNHKSWTWLDIINDLEDVAIFFDERVDEDSGNNTIMFFDVKDFKDIPKGSSAVTTEYLGLYSGILVKTYNGDAEYANECVELCDESDNCGQHDLQSHCVYSQYHNGWIQDSEKRRVESCDEYFQEDNQPDTVYFSTWNDAFVDCEDDYVNFGIVNDRGHESHFYSEDYVYCDDNDTYYVDGEVAGDNGCRWSDRHDRWIIGNDDEQNAEYQSQQRVFRFTPSTVFGIGFEIEKEDYDEVESKWYPIYNSTGWAKENDSSLDGECGYELVSPAFDLFDDRLDKDIEGNGALKHLINANYGTACGGHLTFSSCEYTANELLEGVAGFIPLLYSLYNGRLGNGYCEPKQKWVYHRGSGRDAVNIRGNRMVDNTGGKMFGAIEFRLFSAVRNVTNLKWRRDLMRIIAKNINKSEQDVLRMLCNPKSLLFKHLIKVYSVDKIVGKIRMFVDFSKQYNFRKISMPDLDAVKDKLNKSINKNQDNSTNELGA